MYLIENTNIPINSDFIELVIKSSHIFNDLSLTSKPRIIKALHKSNITVVWKDIWDTQSDKNAKMLINRCFNIGSHITTICRANMNHGVPQCKNCCKWEYMTFLCRIQRSKYVKCNVSSSQTVDLGFLYFTFYFYFLFDLFFYFLFLEQLGLGLIGHTVTSVTI